MYLRQPAFTYSSCWPFTNNEEGIQKVKETGDSRYIYQNELGKACFQYDIAYGEFKDLTGRTAADKVSRNKALKIAKSSKHDEYQGGLPLMVCKFFNKKIALLPDRYASGGAGAITSNKELAEELHKPIMREFEKRKVHSSFIDNIWGADLADMQLISRFNNRFRFWLCVIDVYSKYV